MNGMNQINSQNAERVLLKLIRSVQQRDVNNHVTGNAVRFGEETQPDPCVLIVVAGIITSGRRVGVDEELLRVADGRPEAFDQLLVFAVEHSLQTFLGNITRPGSINGIADGLVISRDGLCDGSGGRPDF